jgi:hypothetical protein
MTAFDAPLLAHYVQAGLHDGEQATHVSDQCRCAASCWSGEPENRRPPRTPTHRGEAYVPWIGAHYAKTRLLILGENFYEHGGWDEARQIVRWTIPKLKEGVRRMTFDAKGYKGSLFQHRSAEYARLWLSSLGVELSIGEVYDHVAFTNHIKCSPRSDGRGRSRPNDAMWTRCGQHVLAAELGILETQRVLLVGRGSNAPAFRAHVWPELRSVRGVGRVELLRDAQGREALVVPHPAGRGGAARRIAEDVVATVTSP